MGAIETLKLIVSADTGAASLAFQKLGKDAEENVGKAEGASNKMSGAMRALSANAVPIVAGLVAAAVGLGLEFEHTAIKVGDFATVTGMSTEQASRLRVVSEHLGVSTEVLGKGIGIMLKTAGNAPKEFEKFGVAIAHTKDGAVDANATFLSVIDRLKAIKDPAEQNAAGAKLLGKAWKEMAPLVDAGSASLVALEAAVPKGEIIHAADVVQAREFKASIGELESAGKAMALEIGKDMVPALTGLAKAALPVVQGFGKVVEGVTKVTSSYSDYVTSSGSTVFAQEKAKDAAKKHAEALDALNSAQRGYGAGLVAYSAGLANGVGETEGFSAATKTLVDNILNGGSAYDSSAVAAQLDAEAKAKAAEATKAAAEVAKQVAEAQKTYTDSVKESDAAIKAFTAAEKAAGAELKSEHDAARAAADSHYALKIATDKAKTAEADYGKAMQAAKGDTTKQDEAAAALKDTLAAQADATVRVYEETAKSNGVTLTLAQTNAAWTSAMLTSVSTMTGPQRQAISDYISQVGQVPADKVTEFKADVAAGDLAGAQKILDDVAAARQAQIQPVVDPRSLDAIDGAIQNQLNQRQFTVPVNGVVSGNVAGSITGGSKKALGGPVTQGSVHLVGEQGPEIFVPNESGKIIPNSRIGGGGGGGGSPLGGGNITVNMTVNAGLGANGLQIGQQAAIALNEALLKLKREQGPNK